MNEELAHLKKEKEHKERDARMKYGKRYKEVMAKGKKQRKNSILIPERKVFVYDKKGSGYMKGGVKKNTIGYIDRPYFWYQIMLVSFLLPFAKKIVSDAVAKDPR